MADGLRREAGRRDSAVMYLGARWPADLPAAGVLTCMPPQTRAQQQRRGRSPLRPPMGGSRKGPGPTCLPMCPYSYQHHERALMKTLPATPSARRSRPWQCRCRS